MKDKKEYQTKLFKTFLKERNAYKSFCENTTRWHLTGGVEVFLKSYAPEEFFCCAFDWDESEQGHSYWEELNDDWLEIIGIKTGTHKIWLNGKEIELSQESYKSFKKQFLEE